MYEARSAPIPAGPSPVSGAGGLGVAVAGGAVWAGEADWQDVVWEDDVVDPLDALLAGAPVAAEQLVEQVPGSELAYLLEETLLGEADDHTVVEAVAAWARMASWAAAGMARAAAALADRACMNPAWPASAGNVAEPNVAGEELAMRLGCSRRHARLLVRDGRAFAGALAWTGDALERGQIDPAKARILVENLVDVPVPVALAVQEQVLDGAPGRTPAQLSRDVARALITIDPATAAERYAVAARGRRVDAPRVLADGMAGIWAVLPAVGAARLDSALDSLARGARSAGDPRTLDQLRADLLVGLTAGEVEGSAAVAALARVDGDADVAPASRPDTDDAPGTVPDADADADAAPASSPATGAAPRVCGTSRRTEIRVTVALPTLLGLDDEPADLAGYGPITAEAARALARDGTWRRIVTDPLSGAVLDVGRTRYRPPADLITHVQVRDRACARPGCTAPAESCDLDHTVEFHRLDGTTSATNLGPLCRRDHMVKTDGGFHLTQVEPGVFEWTTPTGHRYRVVPGADLPYEALPRWRCPRPDDAPPF